MFQNHLCFISPKIPDAARSSFRVSVCEDLPLIKYKDGNYYCVLHLPDKSKNIDTSFWEVIDKRLNEQKNDFSYVYFSDSLELRDHKFLTETTFYSAVFDKYIWLNVTFNESVNFSGAIFKEEVIIISTSFEKEVSFGNAEFYEDFSLLHSNFISKDSHINLHGAIFSENSHFYITDSDIRRNLCLNNTNLKGYLTFSASPYNAENLVFNYENAVIDLQQVKIEKPERIGFHSIRLRPSWFINTDSKKFVFTNINWEINEHSLKEFNRNEIVNLEKVRRIPNAKSLLTIAYRQLAENAENNNRFEEASNFRRMAFETEWLEKKEKISEWWSEKFTCLGFFQNFLKKIKRFPYDLLHLGYRWTSFYGESWSWAASVLLFLILAVFPFAYSRTDFYVCPIEKTNIQNNLVCETRSLSFGEGLRQSLATATLQNVESRKPNSPTSETFTILEKILAPLQAALLALAIRRKFMR